MKKTKQILSLISFLLEKYGNSNIQVADHWDGDLTAIGFTNKTGDILAYVSHYGKARDQFFVSLEYPQGGTPSDPITYDEFANLTAEEVKTTIIRHLGLKI